MQTTCTVTTFGTYMMMVMVTMSGWLRQMLFTRNIIDCDVVIFDKIHSRSSVFDSLCTMMAMAKTRLVLCSSVLHDDIYQYVIIMF